MIRLPNKFARVVIDRPAEALDRYFTYRLPPRLSGQAQVGSYVLVPFGPERVPGFIIGFEPETEVPPEDLKDLLSVLSEFPCFDAPLLELAQRVATYYQCRLLDVLHCLVPEGLSQRVRRHIRWRGSGDPAEQAGELASGAPQQAALLQALARRGGQASLDELKKDLNVSDLSRPLRGLRDKGLVEEEYVLEEPQVRPKTVRVAALTENALFLHDRIAELKKKAPKQAQVLQTLAEAGGRLETAALVKACQTGAEVIRQLAEKGLLQTLEVPVRRKPAGGSGAQAPEVALTEEQQRALALIMQSLDSPDPRPVLLYGVTASGKTEVYLQAIAHVLSKGRRCIVLVPEIALTAQTIDIFRSRFGDRVAVLHSGLATGERYDEWRRIQAGEVDIVVGARSAIFAPVHNLGLIIIDEEHENSYKQDTAPRYHARRVALWRAKFSRAGVVLGSATPAVETFYRAQRGEFLLATMPSRVEQRPLARVEIVDMREEEKRGNRGPLSGRLLELMRGRLARGEQTILFLNRRGFSTFVLCRACGHTLRCPNCDVALVLHLETWQLQCHHCDLQRPAPDRCPNCDGPRIGYLGFGTERVAEWVQAALPTARVLRLDRDTTTRKNAHAQILGQFRRHEADILVGTQMVAKGLDFPNVTLVGVIAADVALNLPEFRAGERTFQLLTQVSGRAGRGEKEGLVLIQTYSPEHYAITAAQQQDFEAFYRQEIAFREELSYPPFSTLANLVVSDEDETEVQRRAERLANALRATFLAQKIGGSVLGPAPAPLSKLRGRYRWHILVKTPSPGRMQQVLSQTLASVPPEIRQGVTVDVDPMNMM